VRAKIVPQTEATLVAETREPTLGIGQIRQLFVSFVCVERNWDYLGLGHSLSGFGGAKSLPGFICAKRK
jgi:hypothetical protein